MTAIPWPTPPSTPPPNPPTIPPIPRYAPCCDLAAGGDRCNCADNLAELRAAFGPRDLRRGRLGPVVLDLRTRKAAA